LDDQVGLVGYRTTGGAIKLTTDFVLIDNVNTSADLAAYAALDLDLDYLLAYDEVDGYASGVLTLDGGITLYTADLIESYDYGTEKAVVLKDLKDGGYIISSGDDAGMYIYNAVVVYDADDENDLYYLLVWAVDVTP